MRRTKRKQNIRDFINLITFIPHSDVSLNLAVIGLMIFGTAMISSTAVAQTTSSVSTVLNVLVKQIIFLIFAYIAMLLSNKTITLRRFSQYQGLIFAVFAISMIAPFGFAATGGSHAWIRIGSITIQPSEFGKPLFILICAASVYRARRNREMRKNFWTFFKWPVACLLVTLALLAAQKDYGTAAITLGIVYVCLMIPSYPTLRKTQRALTTLLAAGGLAVVLLFGVTNIGTEVLKQTPLYHIAVRIENAKNPYNDIYGTGYQPANSLYGIADSGFIGKGFGNSARKYGYLTQADND